MFSALRQGSILYILTKGENLSLQVGQVQSVSSPVSKYGNIQPGQYLPNMEMVVDISVKTADGSIINFEKTPANFSIASPDNQTVISESREAMNGEVEGMLRISRQVIDSMPFHQNVLSSGENILRQLNPQLAKEKEQEEKINILEKKITGMEGALFDIKDMLSKGANSSNNNYKKQ